MEVLAAAVCFFAVSRVCFFWVFKRDAIAALSYRVTSGLKREKKKEK
jgi:hypothetical protein